VALRAILTLRQRHEQLRSLSLVLAGLDRGVGADIDREAERAGQAGAVVRLGVVSEARLLALYQHAAAFVYPSRYEGFGLPVLEAMACARPVIASRAGALPEVVGAAGTLCDPDDEGAFTDAVEGVLLSEAAAARMGALARERAAQFRWERAAEQTIEVYRACLNPTSRSWS
jgi:glycosyltransferase involved in cell wall biosynthesis